MEANVERVDGDGEGTTAGRMEVTEMRLDRALSLVDLQAEAAHLERRGGRTYLVSAD